MLLSGRKSRGKMVVCRPAISNVRWEQMLAGGILCVCSQQNRSIPLLREERDSNQEQDSFQIGFFSKQSFVKKTFLFHEVSSATFCSVANDRGIITFVFQTAFP